MFTLDQRLQDDTHAIGDFPLCRLLLSNDSNFPWFILVPRRAGVSEVFDLSEEDRALLWQETNVLAAALKASFAGDKMNVAALGNVVGQLHMHVIVRFEGDPAWPGPIWGKVQACPYSEEPLRGVREKLRQALSGVAGFEAVPT